MSKVQLPIKITQTVIGDDGNCFDANIASVLGIGIDEVPHFISYGSDMWFELRRWLNARGYDYVHFPSYQITTCCLPFVPILCSGDGGRGHRHSVIMAPTAPNSFELELLHDPHPQGNGLFGEIEFYLIIFKKIGWK